MGVKVHRTMWWAGMMVATLLVVSGCAHAPGQMGGASDGTMLTGAQEVPPVNTEASGVSSIAFLGDKVVTGSVRTSNMNGTAAHIHMAPAGQNGPVIIPLVKTAENIWTVPGNTVLSSAQFDALKAGHLYVNVHSAAHPGGEIRAQLKP